MKFPLATSTWDQAEVDAIVKVASSGLCTMGEKVLHFEREFARFVGSRHAVMVNSGSSANLIMVGALFFRKDQRLSPGDEVIVPAVSWPTTYYPLAQYGLELKFVDIDLDTLNYDLDALRSAVGDKTKLIVAVNLLGNPNDFSQIYNIIGKRKIILVEDNCESLGAVYDDRQTGTHGVMGSFSTFFSHHMSTMEGGLVVTDDDELYHILLCLRAHGWTRNLPKYNAITGKKSEDSFAESYKFVLPGYNVRPLEIEGAIGIQQLKKLPRFLEYRRRNAQEFVRLFEGHSDLIIQKEIGQSSWFGFSLVLRPESGIDRKRLISLLTDGEIECRPIVAGNFTKNKVVTYMAHSIHGTLKNAEWIDGNGLFVGNHQYCIKDELEHLSHVVAKL